MSPSTTTRSLLVLAGSRPWIPADGVTLGDWALQVDHCEGLPAARGAAHQSSWDVVAFAVDLVQPDDPAATLRALRALAPDATFLPVAARPDPHEALFFLKNGAFEYLEEPLAREQFLRAVAEAIENRDTFREILDLTHTLEAQKQQLLQEKAELERKNRELEAVSQLVRALASTLEVDQILAQLARSVRDSFQCGRILVGLMDPERGVEELRVAVDGDLEPLEPATLNPVRRWSVRDARRFPWLHTVLREKQRLCVDEPESHGLLRGTPLAEFHRHPFVKFPMVVHGRLVGTLTVEAARPGPFLSHEDLEVLGIFADSAAVAIDNARLYHSMRELSVRDELTGVYNRRHLLQQLEAEWRHAERHAMDLAVLMLDLDHFKQLNDGNDHLTGDEALRRLAKILLRNTRGVDTVARYGGEEFVVMLPRTGRGAAVKVADKLRRIIAETDFEGAEVLPGGRLTVSIGAAVFPEDAGAPRELVERADWALYRAKQGGRNQVVLWEDAEDARQQVS